MIDVKFTCTCLCRWKENIAIGDFLLWDLVKECCTMFDWMLTGEVWGKQAVQAVGDRHRRSVQVHVVTEEKEVRCT